MVERYMLVRLLIIILLISFLPLSAHAHRPYIIKDRVIDGPNGQPVIIEKLYGDGIFGPDPVRLQFRNMQGGVIASFPTDINAAIFCPKINFCWVFPYNLIPISVGLKLDVDSVDFNAPFNRHADMKDDEAEQFKSYLSGAAKQVNSYGFEYPEMQKNSYGYQEVLPSIILSPIAILLSHIRWVLFVGIITPIFVFLLACIQEAIAKQEKGIGKVTAYILGGTLMTILGGLYLLIFLAGMLLISTSVTIIAMLCGCLLSSPMDHKSAAKKDIN